MSFKNEYKRFAITSLDQAADSADKFGRLIVAEAWIDLAEQTNQLVDTKPRKPTRLVEQPLKAASCRGHQ